MSQKQFNDYDYTRDAIIKQLSLVELHGKDGSAVDAGCQCINTKHTYMLEGLCEEMAGFAKSEQEKKFYLEVAELARELRKRIDSEEWSIPANPGRKFLPHGLTACEKSHPEVRKKLASCIRQTEKKPGAYVKFNPVAVCRSSIECP